MDFEAAHRIGCDGEAEVSSELRRLAIKFSFAVIDDLLLDLNGETAQLDHVLVDMYGVVIVETKVRHGALIKGLDAEKRWTACYPGKKHEVFQNPLQQNRQHEAVLRKVLRSAEFLTPDHVRSFVVFIGANLDALELGSVERARVFGIDGIRDYLHERYDFAAAPVLSDEDQQLITDILTALNRSRDPVVLDRHRRNARGSGPRSRSRSHDGPPAVSVQSETKPRVPKAETVFTKPKARPRRRSRTLQNLLGTGAAFALVWWLFFGGGILPVTHLLTRLLIQPLTGENLLPSSAPVPPVAPPEVSPVDVARAKDKLRQADPAKFEALVDASAPRVVKGQGYTTYTWEYLEQSDQRSVKSRLISLTVDDAWVVRGVDIR